jgi:hypothetical protein
MDIIEATESYEAWLKERLSINDDDLEYKHDRMAEDAFEFLRATFYRWNQHWKKECADLHGAPEVLAIGDIHTDNFGSWRDVEARLVWGVNDFDEAYRLPYTFDLVRLAASAQMAAAAAFGSAEMESICEAMLGGYVKSLKHNGRPFVLAEENDWLRDLMEEDLKKPERFWEKLEENSAIKEADVAGDAKSAIDKAFPLRYRKFSTRYKHRTAGLGSLGRERYLAMRKAYASFAAREAKPLTSSACLWALQTDGASGPSNILYSDILANAVRSPDPYLLVDGPWVVRRLSPDYSRIDLPELSESYLDMLLYAMGWETANVHLGSGRDRAAEIRKDIKGRKKSWLSKAAQTMQDATLDDFHDWQEYWNED